MLSHHTAGSLHPSALVIAVVAASLRRPRRPRLVVSLVIVRHQQGELVVSSTVGRTVSVVAVVRRLSSRIQHRSPLVYAAAMSCLPLAPPTAEPLES